MMKLARRIFCAGLASAAAIALAAPGDALAAYPEKPIKVIVPTQAGGGMDTSARLLQRYFDETGTLGTKMVVVNMPGAGGTIGTRAVMEAEPDGYTVGLWHEGIITSNAMGVVEYDHTAFELLGVAGYGILGFGVGEDNEIDSFEELIETARANPNGVKCATNVGLPVHFVPLMVQEAAGVEFRYVQVGGGAKRFPSVVAGHTDFAIFGEIEMAKWQEAGLKPIVLFSKERSKSLPDVPTAKELGVDVLATTSRVWLAPKGTPADRVEYISTKIREAMEDPELQKRFAEAGLVAEYLGPEDTVAMLDEWGAAAKRLTAKARELQQ